MRVGILLAAAGEIAQQPSAATGKVDPRLPTG